MDETACACCQCRRNFPLSELTYFDGQSLCADCLDEETVVCQDCGERVWNDDNSGDDDHPLCERCYERDYARCEICGQLLHNDDVCYANGDDDGETPYCAGCCSRHEERRIHEYYYKPEPIFYGDGPRYMGVELEIDEGGEDGDNAERILDVANADDERVYCKHDGSLHNGFEIVTHPCSPEYHMNEFPWAEILREAVRMGYTSHQARTCGLHIHVSRKAFGADGAEQEVRIARVLYFFEKNWEELLKFSRRTQSQLTQWANRYGLKEHPMQILDHAKEGTYRNRYTCVNLTNADTIEFRMFRGTLKLNTLLATLQLVNRVCDAAISLSDEEMKNLSWTSFAADCVETELIQYLKERRLYVNEPVSMAEEV